MSITVILPAAGLGTRMAPSQQPAGSAPKQFLTLGGVPILVHTLRAFLSIPLVTQVLIAVRPAEKDRALALFTHYLPGEDRISIVEGGDTRQESVSRALAAHTAGAEDDIILVHDAVRPLISPDLIQRTIEAVRRHGAAIAGLPATDTIKQVERTSDGARIAATIPRECIVQAQTPQGFRADILRRAFREAEADGFQGTDEASLAERAGFEVAVVQGSPANIKITQPGDLALAEFYLNKSKA